PGLFSGIENATTQHAPDLVQPKFERRDHAKVAAAAAQTPEEVIVLRGTGSKQAAVRSNDIGGDQVVAGEAVLARQPAAAAAQSQTGDAGAGDHSHGRGQIERLRLAVRPPPRPTPL